VPLEPRDIAAGYAAIVATASLGWQIWNSYRAKRPEVALFLEAWRSSQAGGMRTLESADIRIRNRQDHTIRVDQLYFRYTPATAPLIGQSALCGPSVPAEIETGEVDALPFEVPPREVVSLTIRPSQPFAWRSTTGNEAIPAVVMELSRGQSNGLMLIPVCARQTLERSHSLAAPVVRTGERYRSQRP
jgi:hypothetical protein